MLVNEDKLECLNECLLDEMFYLLLLIIHAGSAKRKSYNMNKWNDKRDETGIIMTFFADISCILTANKANLVL